MWPSQNAISTELTPEHLRERVFGAQFAMLNLGREYLIHHYLVTPELLKIKNLLKSL
jgi:hypothetical protein